MIFNLRISDTELNCISLNLPNLEMLDILGSHTVSKESVEKYVLVLLIMTG